MTDAEQTRPLADVLDGLRFAMLTTQDGGGLEARPLTLLEEADGRLAFLVGVEVPWAQALEAQAGSVGVTFSDPKGSSYVSLRGTGRIVRDRAEVERLWNPAAKGFFDGPDDPAAGVLFVDVAAGEWWDGPNTRIGQAIAMARTILTHDEGAAGEAGSVDVTGSGR